MICEAGARVSIRAPKAPSLLGKRHRNIARLSLQVGYHRKKSDPTVLKNQLSFQHSPLRFLPVIPGIRVQHSLGSSTIELLSTLVESGA